MHLKVKEKYIYRIYESTKLMLFFWTDYSMNLNKLHKQMHLKSILLKLKVYFLKTF